MANYKVIDVDQLEADLTTVADSIRGKFEVDGKLAFPHGMKEVVDGFSLDEELTEQDVLIEQIKTALQDKAIENTGLPTQEKNVEITKNGTRDVIPDDGYTLSKVTVTVDVPPEIPDGYIIPSGSIEITENGTYDVSQYAEAVVNLPVESDDRELYQRVEYIVSAAEETYPYFITDFYADNESGVEVIASFPVLQDRIPMGSRENSDATRFYCVYPMSANSVYYGFNTGSSVTCPLKVNTVYRLQTNFLNSRLINVYDEGGIRKGGTSISATLIPHTVPVAIFGYNSAASGVVSSKREYKFYGARCSKGHEIVREYIPCYRKSDGTVGLYEKFTKQFLLPATGEFAKGPDMEWEAAA